MFSSCGKCCCWCTGECFNFRQEISVVKTGPARVSKALSPQQASASKIGPSTFEDYRAAWSKRASYGTAALNVRAFPASVKNAAVAHRSSNFQFAPNSLCEEGEDEEEIYQNVTLDDLLAKEDRESNVVLDTRRISLSPPPSALYQRWAKKNNTNWPLRKQPLFDQITKSAGNRLTSQLVSPNDSYDSNDYSSVESFEDFAPHRERTFQSPADSYPAQGIPLTPFYPLDAVTPYDADVSQSTSFDDEVDCHYYLVSYVLNSAVRGRVCCCLHVCLHRSIGCLRVVVGT